MNADRRQFLAATGTALAGVALANAALPAAEEKPKRAPRMAVSTYSFWQFKNKDLRDIELCIDLAAEWGFDAVEVLHRQMENESNDTLQKLKQRAFRQGMS